MIALVLGGASCLWQDIRALRKILDPAECVIVAVNDAGVRWPGKLDHWATLHPEELWWRRDRRIHYGYNPSCVTWTRSYPIGMEHLQRICDRQIGGVWTQGSSGLLGVGVAWAGLGIRSVILAGIPMDGGTRLDRTGGWASHGTFRAAWEESQALLSRGVRSLSGWTRDLLGEPTTEWLESQGFTSTSPERILSPVQLRT